MAPTYLPNRSDYFRGWLLSLNDDDDVKPGKALNVSLPMTLSLDGKLDPTLDDTAIRLGGEGSLGSDTSREIDYVSARLLSVSKPAEPSKIAGRYGWWVGDQSQKARLMPDSYQNKTLTAADKIFRSQAPGSMDNKSVSGLAGISNEDDLNKLPSLKTLDLVDLVDLATAATDDAPEVSQLNFHSATIYSYGVLADVREGGLKRDLSTILEQPIRLGGEGEEYMLYEFDDSRFTDRSSSRVPIQDLAAYYQLYDNEPGFGNQRREGVQYNSSALVNLIQLKVPDYDGGGKDRQRFIKEYTTLYRQPVITKVQFLVAMTAEPVTAADRQEVADAAANPTNGSRVVPMRDSDTHKLKLGIMPMVTRVIKLGRVEAL